MNENISICLQNELIITKVMTISVTLKVFICSLPFYFRICRNKDTMHIHYLVKEFRSSLSNAYIMLELDWKCSNEANVVLRLMYFFPAFELRKSRVKIRTPEIVSNVLNCPNATIHSLCNFAADWSLVIKCGAFTFYFCDIFSFVVGVADGLSVFQLF